MPDLGKYLTELPEALTLDDDDILYTVVGSGTTTSKKVKKSTILSADRTARATAEGTIASNFAQEYSTITQYAVGDYCIKDLVLYKCTSSTSGTWDSSKWTQVTALDLTSGVASDLADEIEARQSADETLQGEIDELPVDVQVDGGSLVNEDNIAVLDSLVAYGEASGEIATFSDGSDLAMKSLKVAIEPQQEGSGEPSPTNIRPISGWDECNVGVVGKNQWDEKWEMGYYNAQTGEKLYSDDNIRCKNYITALPNTEYHFAKNDAGVILFYDNNKTFISSVNNSVLASNNNNFTTPNNCAYITFYIVETTYRNNVSINYPSTDTDYHAYNGHTYTIDLDGTRYGGTLDVVSGVLTVTHSEIDLGMLNWDRNTDYTNPFFLVALDGKKFSSEDLICSIYVYGKLMTGTTALNTMSNLTINAGSNSNALYIRDDSYTDVATFKTAMNGVQLVYELATPQTIQLTPTQVKSLLGVNNVWCDTGDVDVVYPRDLNITINNILSRLNALEG